MNVVVVDLGVVVVVVADVDLGVRKERADATTPSESFTAFTRSPVVGTIELRSLGSSQKVSVPLMLSGMFLDLLQ